MNRAPSDNRTIRRTEPLSEPLIRSLEAPAKGKRIVYDGHRDAPRGFGLRITAAGTKAFILRYQPGGKDRILTIGAFPAWSLKAARAQAAELRQAVDQGTDPLEAERARKAQAAAEQAEAERQRETRAKYTLSALCAAYVAHLDAQGKGRSARNAESCFKVHLLEAHPEIAGTPAREIAPDQIALIVRRVMETGKTRTAGVLRSCLNAAFTAARKAPYDTRLPAELIPFGVTTNPVEVIAAIPVQRGERTLSAEELRAYLAALGDELPDQALKLALLAGGQRTAQLLRARVRDYDRLHKTLLLWDGKGRRAQPRAHLIPLASDAAALVEHLVARASETAEKRAKRRHEAPDPNPSLFLSRGRVMVDTTPGKRLKEIAAEITAEPFDLRDIRRTVETLLASLGISKDVRAHLLSHGLSGVQTAHYDRHDYLGEKRAALEAWERHLERLIRGKADNVVALVREVG